MDSRSRSQSRSKYLEAKRSQYWKAIAALSKPDRADVNGTDIIYEYLHLYHIIDEWNLFNL